jgi:hypothetical protein
VAGTKPLSLSKSPELIAARTCYDHLAGRLGVALFNALVEQQAICEPEGMRAAVKLGPRAQEVFERIGIDLHSLKSGGRRFAFAFPDWTERHPHLGGVKGRLFGTCASNGDGWFGGRGLGRPSSPISGSGSWGSASVLSWRKDRDKGPALSACRSSQVGQKGREYSEKRQKGAQPINVFDPVCIGELAQNRGAGAAHAEGQSEK